LYAYINISTNRTKEIAAYSIYGVLALKHFVDSESNCEKEKYYEHTLTLGIDSDEQQYRE